MESKSVFKKQKTSEEKEYKFQSFSLRESHFKSLESKGKTMKSWLHGETIVAYLQIQDTSAFILEDFHTLNMFKNKEVKLNNVSGLKNKLLIHLFF